MHPPFSDGHTQSVSPSSPNGNSHHGPVLHVGQVFIPRQVLNSGVFVPDGLLACRLVSNGAKLLWARLARYAGAKGLCFPLLSTLAADLGFSERQGSLGSTSASRASRNSFSRCWIRWWIATSYVPRTIALTSGSTSATTFACMRFCRRSSRSDLLISPRDFWRAVKTE